MKISRRILIVTLVLIGIATFVWSKQDKNIQNMREQKVSVEGCYVAHIEQKDVYTVHIVSQEGKAVSGNLSFKNYEKDSSSGTFVGTYENSILLADYTFNSEGMTSVMQVIFKKVDSGFVRGYGPVDTEGTRFSDLSAIIYDQTSPLALFTKEVCVN